MAKITEYPVTTSIQNDDVLLVDGAAGTRGLSVSGFSEAVAQHVVNDSQAFSGLVGDVNDLKSDLNTVQGAIEYDAPLSIDGYYINSSNGNASSAASYACTDFVPVSGALKIVYPAYFNVSSVGVAFYDASKSYISGADNTGTIGDVKTTDVPANAKFFRICAIKSHVALYGFYVYMIGVPSALNTKQDALEPGVNVDTTPTDDSDNPVTSGGVYNALETKISVESVSGVIAPVTYPQLLNKDAFLDGKELQNTALVSGPDDMDDSANWTTTNIIELTWDASGGNREFATNLQTGQFKALGYYLRNGAYVRSGSVSAVSSNDDHYVFAMPEINVKMRLSIRNDLVNPDDIIITKADEWTTDPTYGVNVMSLKPGAVHDFNLETTLKDKLLPTNPCAYDGNEFQAFKKVLCVGDSLTEGTFDYIESGTRQYFVDADYSYPTMLAALSGREVVNKGYGGDTFQSWYTRYQNEDLSGFDCAIIELGLNDSTQGTTSADRLTYLGNIVTKLKTENSGIKIFISTILSCYSNNNISAVNADIISFANSTVDCYLMNVYEYGSLKDDTAYAAGHLTALGYQRMAKEYYAYASKIMSENKSDFRFIQYIGTGRQYE